MDLSDHDGLLHKESQSMDLSDHDGLLHKESQSMDLSDHYGLLYKESQSVDLSPTYRPHWSYAQRKSIYAPFTNLQITLVLYIKKVNLGTFQQLIDHASLLHKESQSVQLSPTYRPR